MNIKKQLDVIRKIVRHRIKFLTIYFQHRLNQRYLRIHLDPSIESTISVNSLGSFTTQNSKISDKRFNEEDLKLIANRVFKRASKIQLGGVSGPLNYPMLIKIVALGKQYKMPFITLKISSSNVCELSIEKLIQAGLDEIIVCVENPNCNEKSFMHRANHERIQTVFSALKTLKKSHDFQVKIDINFNSDNIFELQYLFSYFDISCADVLQLIPDKRLNRSHLNDDTQFSFYEDYLDVFSIIKTECLKHKIILKAPKNLEKYYREQILKTVFDYTFCYISPSKFWKDDFMWREETFKDYCKRIEWSKTLASTALIPRYEFRMYL
ncbi:hypothetical protein [Winogradskyella tangerina]|uniref:hypothetical protein n=1 Tax=Winogradskyella tangerina TaxID=2023240 RepID=UPI000DBEA1C1|nr:hypothetical protein [Winogradskyella tangerina]